MLHLQVSKYLKYLAALLREQMWKEGWAGSYSLWIDISVIIIQVLALNFSEL